MSYLARIKELLNNEANSMPVILPPVTLQANPLDSAFARLVEYRTSYGVQTAEMWFKHAERAVQAVCETFPPQSRDNALSGYLAGYCTGQTSRAIATHVIALELWAANKRQRPFGIWIDAASQATKTLLTDNRQQPDLSSVTPGPAMIKTQHQGGTKAPILPVLSAFEKRVLNGEFDGKMLDLRCERYADVGRTARQWLDTLKSAKPRSLPYRAAEGHLVKLAKVLG